MAVLKYYDGDSWEPVASALVGPTGVTGPTGATGATGAAAAFVGCTAYRTNSNISLASGVATAVTLPNEEFDTDGFHDIVSNTSRMTIPTGKGGKYLLVGVISLDTLNLSGEIRWYKNGSAIANGMQAGITNRSTQPYGIMGTLVVDAVATDYFEMFVRQQNTTVNLDHARFSIVYLGA